jgi:hypothetical protein
MTPRVAGGGVVAMDRMHTAGAAVGIAEPAPPIEFTAVTGNTVLAAESMTAAVLHVLKATTEPFHESFQSTGATMRTPSATVDRDQALEAKHAERFQSLEATARATMERLQSFDAGMVRLLQGQDQLNVDMGRLLQHKHDAQLGAAQIRALDERQTSLIAQADASELARVCLAAAVEAARKRLEGEVEAGLVQLEAGRVQLAARDAELQASRSELQRVQLRNKQPQQKGLDFEDSSVTYLRDIGLEVKVTRDMDHSGDAIVTIDLGAAYAAPVRVLLDFKACGTRGSMSTHMGKLVKNAVGLGMLDGVVVVYGDIDAVQPDILCWADHIKSAKTNSDTVGGVRSDRMFVCARRQLVQTLCMLAASHGADRVTSPVEVTSVSMASLASRLLKTDLGGLFQMVDSITGSADFKKLKTLNKSWTLLEPAAAAAAAAAAASELKPIALNEQLLEAQRVYMAMGKEDGLPALLAGIEGRAGKIGKPGKAVAESEWPFTRDPVAQSPRSLLAKRPR